jgi:putative phosphoesterase
MRIALMSDTHGSVTAFNKSVQLVQNCDFILHAGDVLYHGPRNPLPEGYDPKELADAINKLDVPFICAAGNCDATVDQAMLSVPIQAPYASVFVENIRILVTHGHESTEVDLFHLAEKWNINVVITGHTHVKRIEKRGKTTFINPGSCALPKDGIPSIGLIEDFKITLINLDSGEIIQSGEL